MKKILVIEGDKDMLDVVESILTKHGFDVRTNPDVSNIDELLTDYYPDLILLDIKLPGKSGIEICKELKENYTIPVVLFSTSLTREVALKEYNADGFISKPFEIKDFLKVLEGHLVFLK